MIKNVIKQIIASIVYSMYKSGILKMAHDINVCSIDETIDMLLNTENSFVRFGDGEIAMIRGKNLRLQKSDKELNTRMSEILSCEEAGLAVAIVDMFKELDQYIPSTKKFWQDHLLFHRGVYEKYCTSGKLYYNAYFSRCYISIKDKSRCGQWFSKIRQIWKDRKVVVVEGENSLNGVFTDLLSEAASVERIICPGREAYSKYDEILAECKKLSKDTMILVSLGPTAKPLVQELHRSGFRAIDTGNLENEYKWFLAGYKDKADVPKQREERTSKEELQQLEKYKQQIISRIL